MEEPRWKRSVPEWFGEFFASLALFCAVLAVVGPLHRLFEPVRRWVEILTVPASANLAYAAFLMLLAGALAARKRVAYWIVVVLLGLTVLANVLLSFFSEWSAIPALVITGAALTALVMARGEFSARVRKGAFWRALLVLFTGLVFGVLAGWALLSVFPGSVTGTNRLRWAVNRVVGGVNDLPEGIGHPPFWTNFWLGLFGALALLAAAAALFRSQKVEAALHGDDEPRIRALLAMYGEQDSLGYFATRRDKSVIFSPSGKAAVTFRVEVGVCLASGDPLGDMEAWGPAIEAWLEHAAKYGWVPAVMGAGEEGAKAYSRAGLGALELGDEAVLEVGEFDLEGREMRGTRQAVNRVRRTGATSRIRRHSELSQEELDEVVQRADDWRDTDNERGFSMALGRLGDPADGDCLLVEALDGAGRVVALLSFAPWGRAGVSLDVMRRDPAAPNGIMEFMVTELSAQSPRLGIRRISLNFAVFRSVFEEGARIGAGPVLRLWRRLLLFFSRWWQLEALYRSNVKYQPEWYPRFLCYSEAKDMARIGLASGIAEGFVELPRLRFWRERRYSQPSAAAGVGAATFIPLEHLAADAAAQPGPAAGSVPPEQVRVRLRKLERLRDEETDPYPPGGEPTHTLADAGVAPTGTEVRVAGRVLRLRDHGGVVFVTLRDWSGDLQIMLSRDRFTAARMSAFGSDVDLGDLLGIEATMGASRSGDVTADASAWRLNAKCLHPLPDKRRGLTDPEARVRQRYLDLVVRPEAREVLRARSAAVHAVRGSLVARGYLEVETPMLQPVHGGANARPFTTHINAYDLDLYLRIAPELYLKRLCVGGVEKVFELGRTFRNEGVSYKHNPEFTMLEAYEAYGDYDTMLNLTRELIQEAATAANGSQIARREGAEIDLSGLWPVKTLNEAISQALGEEISADTPAETLRRFCDRAGVPHSPGDGRGDLVLEMYERLVEEHTTVPTFYKDFPLDVSPLTRQHRGDPRLAERWDLVAFGAELGTAYTELTDPVEQRRRLTEQSLLAAGGDAEAMELDEDFLTALEYAMPPTGGLGIGIDRMVMFLTGRSIRETLPFPLVRRR
ncbi:bifunctional lysylphosphatidylglycerol synthetase/lysine--tRNA ligase LysX [Streptomyces sp. H10-C2]|uniref:bifunctional lysylphosphatidylglycerol synthetase/lysine--tRNA ligase LysX n=1 Tax=unclassified Streptomyces TaxID=2593676 RepID=UPI0024BB769D|nr:MULTISPECIES: bifunctional lysylphosphatidylglycerol synthetase/lysine--tRNA ligase LysX [unclassified Streptomyces]MDJ0339995.1 bifunctional lysylphosphatidylglycerol synthetase/lysine--tRNA ligase LysX [Streptomyces sp. PH10-H1]MDJ0369368.1 bifunctional lysylphosphatidylglycerol synthetase/lysine--tRNA ligase LysX [Streptomyces sp. H10-C2]